MKIQNLEQGTKSFEKLKEIKPPFYFADLFRSSFALFSAKSWQNPASIDGESEQNKKSPLVGIELKTSWSSTLMLYWLC